MKYDDESLVLFKEQDELTAEQLTMTAQISYEQETRRYDSLVELGNKLLTCISIVFATLAVLFQILIEHVDAVFGPNNPLPYTCSELTLFRLFVTIVVLALVGSIVLALLASMRFKYQALKAPGDLSSWIEANELFANRTIAAMHFCRSLQDSYETLYNRNELVRKLLKASMISLIVAIVLAAIGGIVLLFLV